MKILVTGYKGMLGSAFMRQAPGGHEYVAADEVDITNRVAVLTAVRRYDPDVVLNCAGIVKGRVVTPHRMVLVNAGGPHVLASACNLSGRRLVHISTDCVFSGAIQHTHAYSENVRPDPDDLYGRSKLTGEITDEPHLTIRMSVVGNGPRGLVAWLRNQDDVVPGYVNHYWNGMAVPTAVEEIVKVIDDGLTGVVHLASEEGVTKDRLLRLLVEELALPFRVESVEADTYVNRKLTSHLILLVEKPLRDQIGELR